MTLREAVYKVMSEASRPMHYKDDVWRLIESRRLWQPPHGGGTPWHTARVAMLSDSRYKRVGRGLFELVGRPATGRAPRETPRPTIKMTLREAINAVMSQATTEMHYKDVTREIRARGLHPMPGRTPENSVSMYLSQGPEYRRTRPGYYEMSGRFDGTTVMGDRTPCKTAQPTPDWQQFEERGGELLKKMGLADVKVTSLTGDGGVDAWGVHTAHDGTRIRVALQAKCWHRPVTVREVRELRGVLEPADIGLLVTTSKPASGAFTEASRLIGARVLIIHGALLHELESGDANKLAKWVKDHLG